MSKVNTNFIHLCDAATIDGAGKLNILGIFSIVYLAQVPSNLPKFSAVVSLSFEKIDEKNTLEIEVLSSDGEPIKIDPPVKIDFNLPVDANKKPDLNLILDINNLMFTKFGKHQLKIKINGENIATKEFDVQERKVR